MQVCSFSPFGYEGSIVDVEVDLRRGIPAVDIVGLADGAVRESRERMRSAIMNSGFDFPPERVLISLSSADLRKEGPVFDLPVALAVLQQDEERKTGVASPDGKVLAFGGLYLDGSVERVRGVTAALQSAKREGIKHAIVPAGSGERFPDGIDVREVSNLREARDSFVSISREIAREAERPDAGKPADFERMGIYCQDATRYGFGTSDAMLRVGYLVVGKKDGKPVVRNKETGKSAFIVDGFVPSVQDVGSGSGVKEVNLFGSVSHSGLQIGDRVRAVNHFPAGHVEEGIVAGYVVEGIVDDFDGHNVYVRSSDGESTFRIDRRQWDVKKFEGQGLSKDSPVVSKKEGPAVYGGAVNVPSVVVSEQKVVSVKKEEEPLVKDLGKPVFDATRRRASKSGMDGFVRMVFKDSCLGREGPGGAFCICTKDKDGRDVENRAFYVLHDSSGWEVRRRTPYVDSLLRDGRSLSVSGEIGRG